MPDFSGTPAPFSPCLSALFVQVLNKCIAGALITLASAGGGQGDDRDISRW